MSLCSHGLTEVWPLFSFSRLGSKHTSVHESADACLLCSVLECVDTCVCVCGHIAQVAISLGWPCCTAGPTGRVATLRRWPYCTNGPIGLVAVWHRWPYCTSGPIRRVAILHRTPCCMGGLIARVAILHGWPYCIDISTCAMHELGHKAMHAQQQYSAITLCDHHYIGPGARLQKCTARV